jgi:hypothetical protein
MFQLSPGNPNILPENQVSQPKALAYVVTAQGRT